MRNMLLDDKSRVYFVITTSTQPLLWLSLNFSLSNGISLLHFPTVLSTPLYSAKNVEQIYDTVTVFNHLSGSPPIVPSQNQLQATVALQFQVLAEMEIHNDPLTAQQFVYNRIQQVYERDFVFLYSTDDPTRLALEELANGVAVLPQPVAQNRLRFEKWVMQFKDGNYYLRDALLATFMTKKFKQTIKQLPEISVLWRLIPIGNCFDALAVELPDLKYNSHVKVAMAEYLLCHPANTRSQRVNAHEWRELFRLSRNIMCHEDSVQGDSIKDLCSWFVGLFGSRFAVEEAFSYVSSFLTQLPQ